MITAVLVVAVLGGVIGCLLAVAGKKLQKDIDPRIEQITELLPGANCGACGFAGCQGLAAAIAAGRVGVSPCIACSPANKKSIAAIMGIFGEIPEDNELRRVCRVSCNGCKANIHENYNYIGIHDCNYVAKSYSGLDKCKYGCLGFGSCVKFCPFGAISMGKHGLPVIDYSKCTGCGVCAQQCPQKVLKITWAGSKVHLLCNNRDKGKSAMDDCDVSCISCGLCVKNCPQKAITMVEDEMGSLPVIDRNKCTECGLCVKNCPRHCLHLMDPITAVAGTSEDKDDFGSHCHSCGLKNNCNMGKV